MAKFHVVISKSFEIETKGSEKDAEDIAYSELVEGLSTGNITKGDLEFEIWKRT